MSYVCHMSRATSKSHTLKYHLRTLIKVYFKSFFRTLTWQSFSLNIDLEVMACLIIFHVVFPLS